MIINQCYELFSQVSSYLSVTVYIEDVNDHSPIFLDAPYKVSVDELTPTGEKENHPQFSLFATRFVLSEDTFGHIPKFVSGPKLILKSF